MTTRPELLLPLVDSTTIRRLRAPVSGVSDGDRAIIAEHRRNGDQQHYWPYFRLACAERLLKAPTRSGTKSGLDGLVAGRK